MRPNALIRSFVCSVAVICTQGCGVESITDAAGDARPVPSDGALSQPPPPRTLPARSSARANGYLPLSFKQFVTTMPLHAGSLIAQPPYGCYGGGVWLDWTEIGAVGTLPHTTLLESDPLDCSDSDLHAVRQEAAANGGNVQAEVTLWTEESFQYGVADTCVRGFYEFLQVRLPGTSRVFSNHAFVKVQELTASQCDQLITIAGPALRK